MIVTLGDLVEDVVVGLSGPLRFASDTDARIARRRGGSAANVAAAAARLGAPARFVGQVGVDAIGAALVADLADDGVDVSFVRRAGRTATIVVLVDATGERSMLVDPGSARELAGADPAWLDGADVLHLTLYSLVDEPVASTSRDLVALAHERSVPVSVDVSSVGVIEELGAGRTLDLVASLRPALVFANADEAAVLDLEGPIGRAAVIVKRGGGPCVVHVLDRPPAEVPATPIEGTVDTTGAGDAFAAGVLADPAWRSDLTTACRSGHRTAHALLAARLVA